MTDVHSEWRDVLRRIYLAERADRGVNLTHREVVIAGMALFDGIDPIEDLGLTDKQILRAGGQAK